MPLSYASLLAQVRSSYYNNAKRKIELEEGNPCVLYFIRPLSFYFTPFFLWLKLSPNQASWLSCGIGIAASLALSTGRSAFLQMGAWLFLFYYIVDYVDGNIARVHGTTSHYGKFLDGVVGEVVDSLFWLCLGMGIYRRSLLTQNSFLLFSNEPSLYLLVGGVATAAFLGTAYVIARYGQAVANLENILPKKEGETEKNSAPIFKRPSHKQSLFRFLQHFQGGAQRVSCSIRAPGLFLAAYVSDWLPVYLLLYTVYYVLNCIFECAVILYVGQRKLDVFRSY